MIGLLCSISILVLNSAAAVNIIPIYCVLLCSGEKKTKLLAPIISTIRSKVKDDWNILNSLFQGDKKLGKF